MTKPKYFPCAYCGKHCLADRMVDSAYGDVCEDCAEELAHEAESNEDYDRWDYYAEFGGEG
jgi:transcription elongation factor Elf1